MATSYVKTFSVDTSFLSVEDKKVLEKLTAAAELIAPLYGAQKNSKYPGANFYPHDASREEIEEAAKKNPAILGAYTFVERNTAGKLVAIPYSKKFKKELAQISKLLKEAAALSKDKTFAQYVETRASDFLRDDFTKGTVLYLMAGDSKIGCVIGAFNRYDDKMFLKKRAYTAWVGILDESETEKMRRFQRVILAGERKFLPGAKRTKVSKLGIRVEQTLISAGVEADFLFCADNIPTSVDLRIIEKHGMISTIFKPMVEERFETWIYPIAQKVFHEHTIQKYGKEELQEAFLRLTGFGEVSHSTIRYDDIAPRLGRFSVGLDEVYADILTVKNAGFLYLKSVLSERELETIVLAEICQALYYLQAAKERPHLESFADGYALLLNEALENNALQKANNGFTLDLQKALLALDELAQLFEYYLSLATRKDAQDFLTRFPREKVLATFAPYLHGRKG